MSIQQHVWALAVVATFAIVMVTWLAYMTLKEAQDGFW